MSQNTEFRVFISSTFLDLHEEREILVKRVFPDFRRLCRQRGVTFTEVDLRWGLTDEDIALGQVLRACLPLTIDDKVTTPTYITTDERIDIVDYLKFCCGNRRHCRSNPILLFDESFSTIITVFVASVCSFCHGVCSFTRYEILFHF